MGSIENIFVMEEINEFPKFTQRQWEIISQAMTGRRPLDAIIIEKFNYTITRRDISTLHESECLIDTIINFYMKLLTERGRRYGYPSVYAMETFFTPILLAHGYSAVQRWTRRVDLFAFDLIPVPVHVNGNHWCMAIINMRKKWIKYYDSMGGENQEVLTALLEYLREESLDKRNIDIDLRDWKTRNVKGNPQQENGSDCGVFSCMTAEFICRKRPISFDQGDMNYFRQRMVLEICTGQLVL